MKRRTSPKRSWSRWTLALSVFAACLVSIPRTAEADLAQNLVRATIAAQLAGYSCRDPQWLVRLSAGQAVRLETTLFRGNRYKLIGVGDDTIQDLDLELYDENWNLVSSDTGSDNIPVVEVSPKWTGTFYYKISVYKGSGASTAMICYKD